jgi:thiol-activated cytolysin
MRIAPLSLLTSSALLSACAAQATDLSERAALIDAYIGGIGSFAVTPAGQTRSALSSPQDDDDFSCAYQDVAETKHYDRLVAYSANSDSLWPGAMIDGRSLTTGQLTQLTFDRAPLSISVSLGNLDGKKSFELATPKLSSYREAVSEILASELSGSTPANLYAEIEEVHSQEQLALALGAEVDWLSGAIANISASFNFNDDESRSRYLVKYTQSYYTVDLDPPANASDFFDASVTVDDVQAKIPEDNPPMYVSSVTYGRMILFTFESEYSATELEAALDFAYRGGVDVSGNVSVSYQEMLSRSKVNAFILGGSGAAAAKAIDSFDALMDFIHSGGDYSPDSPGSPIAYKLNYLGSNEPTRVALTEDYTVKECTRVSQKVLVTLDSIEVESTSDDGEDLEIFGSITATGNGEEEVLFERDSDHDLILAAGETWPQQGSLAETILDVTPEAGQEIQLRANLFDNDGLFGGTDSLGDETFTASFETGWRRQVSVLLTGDNSRVRVTYSLQPI